VTHATDNAPQPRRPPTRRTRLGRTVVIANPAAGGGAVGRLADVRHAIRRILQPHGSDRYVDAFDWVESTAPGDGARRAELAVLQGAETILSLGGDGTHSEVVNGIMRAAPAPGRIQLGVLHAGTGGDFCRLVYGDDDLHTTLRALRAPWAVPIDVGAVSYIPSPGTGGDAESKPVWAYFLNLASCGIGGLVDRYVNRSSKRLGARMTYLTATLRALAAYTPPTVQIVADGRALAPVRATAIFVANGRYAGGGMALAPDARLNDGLFDVVVVRTAPLRETVKLVRHLYGGTLEASPLVTQLRCTHLELRPLSGRALVDIDGDAPGELPASFAVVPGAIRLLNPLDVAVQRPETDAPTTTPGSAHGAASENEESAHAAREPT